ncbi:hypothetical protein SKAU_G00185600 [Synaphobranchus kaupii]|uniref:Uncharacterized protein n=1 Tax=Synaphobranchus kaupii TaxID=118154 RepID=A0A9Q1IWD6_SYNKA|nr:hypothetical protein SKAU_G00185600 [Synaphobranchus kaupii]
MRLQVQIPQCKSRAVPLQFHRPWHYSGLVSDPEWPCLIGFSIGMRSGVIPVSGKRGRDTPDRIPRFGNFTRSAERRRRLRPCDGSGAGMRSHFLFWGCGRRFPSEPLRHISFSSVSSLRSAPSC